jgi:hypothetical protein
LSLVVAQVVIGQVAAVVQEVLELQLLLVLVVRLQ